jgi:hypothetical protein
MMTRLLSASFLLPFLLVSPMVAYGSYGLSLAEIMTVLAGAYVLLVRRTLSSPVPTFIVLYECCFAIGWALAIYNATRWGITVGVERLTFFYVLTLPLLAYQVGRHSAWDVCQIVTGRFSAAFITAVGILAVVYPFLSGELSHVIFNYFWTDTDDPRFLSPRFPGVGINANVYSYLVFFFFVFAFDAYLRNRASYIVPLFSALIIVAAASRLVISMVIVSAVALWLNNYRTQRRVRSARPAPTPMTLRPRTVVVALLVCAAAAGAIRYSEELRGLQEAFVFLGRFEAALDATSTGSEKPFAERGEHWALGMERVSFAPVLGISMPLAAQQQQNIALYYAYPHNEFLYMWSAYGLAGLLAHVGLITYLFGLNLRAKAGLPWLIIYASLVPQMFFDGAFASVRFVTLFFVFVGLNVRYLRSRERVTPESKPPPTDALRAGLA